MGRPEVRGAGRLAAGPKTRGREGPETLALSPHVGLEVLSDFERASHLEWLVTNGLGGYSAGTLPGTAARRYHGLLVAAVRAPTDRVVTVSALDESVRTPRGTTPLSTHQWPGVVDPRGYLHLDAFTTHPRPTWSWRVDNLLLDRSLFLVQGRNTAVLEYRHVAGPPCELTVRPFVVMRDHHALTHENPSFHTAVTTDDHHVLLAPYEALPPLSFATSGGRFLEWPAWYKNFEFAFESERGMDFREDAMSPGTFVLDLAPGARWLLVLSLEPAPHRPPGGAALEAWVDVAWSEELARLGAVERAPRPRRRATRAETRLPREALALLARAADQFWVEGEHGTSVIAGYPWFTDWGRDSMISLPGLTRATGRLDRARAVLETFARHSRDGLMPNRFVEGKGAAPDYGSVDAALWFAVAGADYLAASKDKAFLAATIAPALADTLDSFARGTRFAIAQRPDGLLACGTEATALTWMDARIEGVPVTPRAGLPVEINALWYNAWRTRAAFAGRLGDEAGAARASAEADRIREAFAPAFWEPARGWLADRVDELGAVPALRPNQLYAISLPHPVFEGAPALAALDAVEKSLLAPFGLRTLAQGDARYRGSYLGSPATRDAGYHNGTVWPFLLGAWADAHFRLRGRSPETRAYARRIFGPLVRHLAADACLGSISEIFDGDLPSSPRGAFAQAWSVAELARIWIDEDL
ncbi:MAG: amylo-alpha-1,6-glucosidase [Candidatus Eisenbacteria bacterium]